MELGHVLTGIMRPADLCEAVRARLDRALPADSLFLSRVDEDSDTAWLIQDANGDSPGDSPPGERGDQTYRASGCLAIRDRRPVLHLPGDPAAAAAAAGTDARNRPAISAPILFEGRTVGVLTALGRSGSVYDTGDLEFLAAAGSLLAPTVSNLAGPSLAAGDAHGVETDAIDQIVRSIASQSTHDALERTVQAAHVVSLSQGTAIWLVRTGGDVEVVHSTGALAPRRGEKLALSHDLFRELAGQREPMRFDNQIEATKEPLEFRRLTRGTTGFVVPLHAQDRLLGALVTCYGEGDVQLPASRLDALQRMGSIAAIAAGYARLNDQIGTLSLIDPMTGVPNRRQLFMYLEKEFAAARRGRSLTLLLFDIDDFEAFNRENGRQAGDEVVRAFAEMLVQQTRAMNLAARFDGDSFIVALADADRRAGFIHASRIARAAEAHPLIGPSGVHASVGISSYAPRMKSFEDLLTAAEKDLDIRRTGGGRLTI